MHKYNNITIIGTSHISSNSIKEITKTFHEINPDIICVELDKDRFEALVHNYKPNYSPKLIFQIGLTGYLFALIGGVIQKKLGSIVGVEPGADMLCAINLARDNKKLISLIDQNITITLRRLNILFTFREKARLFFDIIRSPFSKKLSFDLTKVPKKEFIREILILLKTRYPGLYKALIEERNEFMAKKISFISKNHLDKKILVIIGAGHEEELFDLTKTYLDAI